MILFGGTPEEGEGTRHRLSDRVITKLEFFSQLSCRCVTIPTTTSRSLSRRADCQWCGDLLNLIVLARS